MNHIKEYNDFINEDLNEGWLGTLAKFALALPKVAEYVGFASRTIGKQFNSDVARRVGDFLVQYGKDLETKYQENISKVVGPMLKDPSRKDQVTRDLIYALTAKNAGMAFVNKRDRFKDPRRSVMNVLDSVDKENIVSNMRELFPKLVR